jgi:hypothetical protein
VAVIITWNIYRGFDRGDQEGICESDKDMIRCELF